MSKTEFEKASVDELARPESWGDARCVELLREPK